MLTQAALTVSLAVSAWAQATSYAPIYVDCPSTSLISRTGDPTNGSQQLNPNETSYLENRRSNVSPQLWQAYLNDTATGNTGYDVSQITNAQPKIAIAVSGGGLRASMYAVGTLSALDGRNSSTAGGLWQLADYLAGLSGGSWAVTSVSLNDMIPIYELVLGANNSTSGGWELDMDILAPGGILGVSDNTDYYDTLLQDVRDKANAGFPVSLTDAWGRALAYHFLNGTNPSNFYSTTAAHDQGTLFGSIRYTQNFQAGAMPIPLLVSTSRVSEAMQTSGQSTTVIPLGNTQFEFTPFTFGSYDPTLSALIPVDYAGTALSNGEPSNSSACVNWFDSASFFMGTSASLFNAVQQEISNPVWTELIQRLLSDISDIQPTNDSIALVANYPNTFRNFQPASGRAFESSGNEILQLTDGGENGENVPIGPLLVKARAVDFILAADASADTDYYWPNGTSLLATAARSANYSNGYTNFPPIPASQDDFVSQGLNVRPTFFGCNSTTSGNMTASGSYPIVVYLPNAPAPVSDPFLTNTSTFTLNYSYDEVEAFLDSAHLNAIKGFPNASTPTTADPNWPLCLKCATIDRARERAGVNRSAACETCFDRYCWTESIASSLTNATGRAGNKSSSSGASSFSTSAIGFTTAAVIAAGFTILA